MSRRITLSDFEIRQLVLALRKLQSEPSLNYAVVTAGKELYNKIIEKLVGTTDSR